MNNLLVICTSSESEEEAEQRERERDERCRRSNIKDIERKLDKVRPFKEGENLDLYLNALSDTV